LGAFVFGWIDKWAAMAAIAPGIANGIVRLPMIGALIKRVVGIANERTLPAFARKTFREAFAKRPQGDSGKKQVVLWTDTFNNNFRPETLNAAVEVLEAAGFCVTIPEVRLCCGRPLYDHGFLDMAQAYLEKILDALREPIARGIPVVVLEPSCCSVFRDEMIDLFPKRDEARKLAELAMTLAEFLEKYAPNFSPPKLERDAIVQGHCHHKAIMRLKADQAQLSKLGLRYEVLESGCCGMAGAFGYEADKYEVSQACGERVLLPRVRQTTEQTLILADGFSCREQIEQATGRKTLHLAEVMRMALRVR
jgi:Fe-S oxidoreductase